MHANPVHTNIDPINHSSWSRAHAQFIADLIADECRINSHSFKNHEDEYTNLIRHHELAQVKYSSGSGESLMPVGLETHDVYFIQ